jgi:membrane associated rhomboid family serine protease
MLFAIPYERLTLARAPWVGFGIAAVWLLAALGRAMAPDAGWDALPLQPHAITPLGAAGHVLLHESWAQLLAALLVVLMVAPVLEEAWGHAGCAALLVLLIAAGTGVQILLAPAEEARPLVGASSAMAGLLGACLVRQLADGIHYTAVGWWREPVHVRFWVPAYALLPVWFVGEVLMQAVDDGLGPTRGTGYAGPLACAALGAAVAFAMRRWSLEERWLGRTAAAGTGAAIELADRTYAQSGLLAALRILRPIAQETPGDADAVAAICRLALADDKPELARPILVALMRESLREGETSTAAGAWTAWGVPLGRPALDPRLSVQLAQALVAHGQGIEAARVLRRVLDTPGQVSAGLAVKIVDVIRTVHAGLAIRAANLALESGDFAEARRERLEALVRELESRRAGTLDPELDEDTRTGRDRSIEVETDDDLRRPPAGVVPAVDARAQAGPLTLGHDGTLVGGGSLDLSGPDAFVATGLDAAAQPRFSDAKCVDVVPVAWDGARVSLRRCDAAPAWLELGQVQAIASGAVRGLAPRPVVLIDLLMNWSGIEEERLRVLRIRSDRFDPRELLPGAGSGLDAFRTVIAKLLADSRATPVPDAARASGRPFAMFDTLAAYEREVLLVDR